MNKKGQALVEFVLILPVFIFLIFSVYDFGRIFNEKNALENISTDIIELFKNGSSIEEINNLYSDLSVSLSSDTEYQKITISDNIKLITPGFNRIFGNPYTITLERYLPNE